MDSQTTAFLSEQKPMRRLALSSTARALLCGALGVQALHVAAVALLHHAAVASNILQALAPLLCAVLCLHQAARSGTKNERRRWIEISAAFLIWTIGQGCYLYSLVFPVAPRGIPYSDIIWLTFAFPILLAASSTPQSPRRDEVGWLDTAQCCVFFIIVYALLYSSPAIIHLSSAYNMQSFALLLALAIRYSMSRHVRERLFYRDLTVYVAIYAVCSAICYALWERGTQPGTPVDLLWTFPFTCFVVLVLWRGSASARFERWSASRISFPRYLHGVSALGLAVMSLVSSAALAQRSPPAGGLLLAVAFVLFATRTSAREWQLQTAHEGLQRSALHDSLTGLANRTMLEQALDARLQGTPGAEHRHTGLLFIDLDRFKTINDGLGHAFGDKLLIRVGELLRGAVRTEDIVARHGGDEFVILLEQVDAQEAEALAQRVIDNLRAPLQIEGRVIHVTASVGVVLSGPGATSLGMLQDADCAMYKAKGLGKDRAQIFAPKMLTAAKYRMELETELREALAQGALEVHYQPIYTLSDNTIQGFEALARWHHPQRGLISPAQFIPIAEDTGLIVELGRQVLDRACHQCQAWNERFSLRLSVAVNVSARQLAHLDLVEEVALRLRESRLDPRLLKLEITESVLLSGYQMVEEVLTRTRELGVAVCLDDFGTGYSSLSYLLRFPFDIVKVDRSFVRHLDRDHRRAEMVRMVVQLAAALKKEVIAEGVESLEELAHLRDFGCDMVQGFLFAKPLAPEAVTALLASGDTIAQPGRPSKKARPIYVPPLPENMPLTR